jgi:uncharacterized membrane protein
MTKYDFMRELESLLLDISLEERLEALQYYENYFEDAGPDREQSIITELGSPTKVATTIKADLYNDHDSSNRGFFTERGYEDSSYKEPKYEIIDGTAVEKDEVKDRNKSLVVSNQNEPLEVYNLSQNPERLYTKSQTNNTNTNTNTNSSNSYDSFNSRNSNDSRFSNDKRNSNNRGNSNDNRNSSDRGYGNNYTRRNSGNSSQTSSGSRIILIILLGIFALPIGLPLIISAFAVFVALLASAFALWISFTIVGVVLTFVGIGLTVLGIVKLVALPALGIAYAGAGLILFGVGLLFTIATVGLSIKVIPGIFRGFINLCRLPFRRRSVIA